MINEVTDEVKYWIINALDRIEQAAFRWATIEQGFQVALTEIRFTHVEANPTSV